MPRKVPPWGVWGGGPALTYMATGGGGRGRWHGGGRGYVPRWAMPIRQARVIIRPGLCPVALRWAGLLNNCQTNHLTGD